ncbi:MAG TPA: uroporphyrinogen-III C-methyltransferase [Candidatus Sulfotelmatobacter sp.]|nr:uroporphyrinogen-III C-methyltransferase [Candidatus Sulfotelmatobacter sp.]
MKGKVYLVGAGPGDPELLTLKALRLLRTAEAVLHDDLVGPEILRFVSPAAQIHNVGKRSGRKKIRQEEINFLMIELAASGLDVVRLKSGDPLIFGRAGEEIDALRRAGIACEIVPGVTSALGAAAATQIPLTHRQASHALVLITGHQAFESNPSEWSKFVGSGVTLVIYMPGQNYADLADRLISAGLERELPCAVISQATTEHQQVHRTSIADLPRAPRLASPTLLVVGEVVRLADPAVLLEQSMMVGSTTGNELSAVSVLPQVKGSSFEEESIR